MFDQINQLLSRGVTWGYVNKALQCEDMGAESAFSTHFEPLNCVLVVYAACAHCLRSLLWIYVYVLFYQRKILCSYHVPQHSKQNRGFIQIISTSFKNQITADFPSPSQFISPSFNTWGSGAVSLAVFFSSCFAQLSQRLVIKNVGLLTKVWKHKETPTLLNICLKKNKIFKAYSHAVWINQRNKPALYEEEKTKNTSAG